MPLKLNSTGGGSVTLDTGSTAATYTLTVPSNTGTLISTASTFAGTGPVFSAFKSGTQTLTSNVDAKITFTSENFDTANCFDLANSRFTPNVAGYYQFNYGLYGGGSTNTQATIIQLFKNGSVWGMASMSSSYLYVPSGYSDGGTTGSAIMYMNGTTDYAEIYGRILGSGTITCTMARFDGCLIRAA